MILEGAQAGLSWSTILKKRAAYRKAFDGFDPEKVARYSAARVRRLMNDAGIVRNRAKIEATIANARAFLAVQREHGSFDTYIWRFVGGRPVRNAWRRHGECPAETDASRAMSRDLLARGFRFVGPTICLRFHAGDRHGQRSSARLFPLARSRTRSRTALNRASASG